MNPDAELHQAIAAHRAGQLPAAEALYRAFLKGRPGHGGANHNLGLLIVQRGEPEQALAHFRIACQAEPDRGQNWFSYAKAMLASGRAAEALGLLERAEATGFSAPAFNALLHKLRSMPASSDMRDAAATANRYAQSIARDPSDAELHLHLGTACAAQGRIDDAIAACRRAIALKPDFAEAHFRLGSLLSEHGEIAEGFAHYMRRAELVYGRGGTPKNDESEPPHKIKHDREQRDYLAGGRAGTDAPAVAGMFHLEDGDRLAGIAINPANATPQLLAQWQSHRPQMVVIDNFLTAEALEKLRGYCAGSTVWRRIYGAGYIGATPEDGFACPLLAQIADEIRSTFPDILAAHRFAIWERSNMTANCPPAPTPMPTMRRSTSISI